MALYKGLQDRLFGADGSWDMSRCTAPGCGLVWLNPMPVKEDIGKAYRVYYTHRDATPETPRADLVTLVLTKVYRLFLKILTHSTGLRKRERECQKKAERMFLGDPVPEGRLLDVGCGNGDFLARMREVGWSGEGVDTDPGAVENARARHDLNVHLGRLEELRLPGGLFDAITMGHVIEHVSHPVSMVRECHRLLKNGGRLVLMTPNVSGLGHRWFGEHWRGLEPPRHLQLFTPEAVRTCAEKAGFSHVEVWSTPRDADGMIRESMMLRESAKGQRRRVFPNAVSHSILVYYEVYRSGTDPGAGEEIVLIARKAG